MEVRKEKVTMIGNISKDTEGKIFAERTLFIFGSKRSVEGDFRSRTERLTSKNRITDGRERMKCVYCNIQPFTYSVVTFGKWTCRR